MKTLLEKVRTATKAMENEPYDDKTLEAVLKATKKAMELYDKLKETKANK